MFTLQVVGELMKGSTSSPAGAELEEFIKHQPIFDRRSVPVRTPLHPVQCLRFRKTLLVMRQNWKSEFPEAATVYSEEGPNMNEC